MFFEEKSLRAYYLHSFLVNNAHGSVWICGVGSEHCTNGQGDLVFQDYEP